MGFELRFGVQIQRCRKEIDQCHGESELRIYGERDAAPDPAGILSGEDPDFVGGFEGRGGRVSYQLSPFFQRSVGGHDSRSLLKKAAFT